MWVAGSQGLGIQTELKRKNENVTVRKNASWSRM